MSIVAIDFETLPIAGRPAYPPPPVGLALHAHGMEARYLSWGHKTGRNNSTEAEAKEALWNVWRDPSAQKLFHHSKFDVAVATERWGFPMLPWDQIDDTLFLAFLLDPHSRSAGLKELAFEHLDMPPDERDGVAIWVQANKRALEAAYPWAGKVQKGKEGAWIFAAPAELVEPYACGDVIRTLRLFDYMRPHVEKLGMLPAYDRERELMPILMENERVGMRLDFGIVEEIDKYERAFKTAEDFLRRELNASGLNFDSDEDTAETLVLRGIVREDQFARTKPTAAHPNGVLSMSKDTLFPDMFAGNGRHGASGAEIASVLGYRNRLKTCLDMFMKPWADQASINAGMISTNWNQVRSYGAGGTRTGRPSTNKHNFLNVSKSFDGRDDQYAHPAFLQLPTLPLCRNYILPDEGEIFIHRDFNGQELRIFADFEQGDLWGQYQDNPRLDVHAFVGAEMESMAGRAFERTKVKTINFQSMYGGGIPALQTALRITTQEAKELKLFHNKALPGRVILNEEIQRIIARGGTISTWGGRLYVEEPRGADGRSKVYKLINYLIQGSAADLTKQAIIDWHKHPDRTARFLVTVYDELNASASIDGMHKQMRVLKDVMEERRLTVPMLSDGKFGRSWGTAKKYNDASPHENTMD